MRRREFVGLFFGAAVCPSHLAAQPSGRMQRIGFFWPFAEGDPEGQARFAAVAEALQNLGWTDGTNVSFGVVRAARKDVDLSALAREMVATNPDVIVVATGGQADLVHKVTRTIPIVVCSGGDLEGTGLIASLNRPGGNVTGSQLLSPALISKRVDLLKQLVPRLHRLGIVLPITPAAFLTTHYLEVIDQASHAAGVQAHRAEVRRPDEYPAAFAALAQAGCQAAAVLATPLSTGYRAEVIAGAASARIPTMYEFSSFVRDGGLISYGPDILPLYRLAATYVDKVLRGANPGELPVNQPVQFELAINLTAAKALGLAASPTLLALADEVIE